MLVAAIVFVGVLVVAGIATWPRFARQEESAAQEPVTVTAESAIPPMDAVAPAATETATFALG